jgi:hypothetical protein
MSTVRGGEDQRFFSARPGQARRYAGVWGSLEVSDLATARRSGVTRYRLEIFPPGTNSVERRELLRFRQWRLWGALAALLGEFLVGTIWPGWMGPIYIAVAYIAALMFGLQLTKRLRKSLRGVTVATILAGGSTYTEGEMGLLQSCVADFERLDREYAEGLISPVQYESAWANLYARVLPESTGIQG